MGQGLNNRQACLQVGVHHDRDAVEQGPEHGEPHEQGHPLSAAISARYLPEEKRIRIGDLHAAGQSQRFVAADWGAARRRSAGRSAATSAAPGTTVRSALHRRAVARRPSAEIGQTGPRPRVAERRARKTRAPVEPAADLPLATALVPRPDRDASGARSHLPSPSRAGMRRNCDGNLPRHCGRAAPAQTPPPTGHPPTGQHQMIRR